MKDRTRTPLFMGPSDIDWLVANHARSGGLPRTFLPCCDDEDADVAVAMSTAETTIGAAVFVWRAIRALIRPLFPERTVVVRVTTAEDEPKDVSEAA